MLYPVTPEPPSGAGVHERETAPGPGVAVRLGSPGTVGSDWIFPQSTWALSQVWIRSISAPWSHVFQKSACSVVYGPCATPVTAVPLERVSLTFVSGSLGPHG